MKNRRLSVLLSVFISSICFAEGINTVQLRGTLSDEKILGVSQIISKIIRTPGVSREVEEINLGSITGICQTASWHLQDPSRNLWITPAHVVTSSLEDIKKPNFKLKSGKDLKLEMIDTSMDLALFSSSSQKEPCVPLDTELNFKYISNIESARAMEPVLIHIETPLIPKWSYKNRGVSTWLGLTTENGISGRDDMGPVLEVIAPGFLGQSGGALLREKSGIFHLVGMILSVDNLGIKLAALPSTTIIKRINDHFLEIKPSVIDRVRTPSGTLYLKNNLIHLRQWTSNAYRDAGSGGLNDGGTFDKQQISTNFSGILENDKRWLTCGSQWVEHEAFEKLATFDINTIKALFNGIYEKNGKLFASQANTILPQWLPTLSHTKTLAYYFKIGVRKKKNITKSIVADKISVLYREKVLPSSMRSLSLYIPPTSETRGIVFIFFLEKNPNCNTKECPIILSANYSIQRDEKTFENAIGYHLDHPTDWRKLKNNGLRYFYDEMLSIVLTRKSGFQIRIYPQNEKLDFVGIITGPVIN
ncbi:MAG: hypothetical protein HY072_02420 [Deltaproteobacteria bacterium]|nr:hypothetical protein [Deltaproteobacteria bacterium]